MYDLKFYQEAAAACRAASRDTKGRSSPYLIAMAEHYDSKAVKLDQPAAGDQLGAISTS